MVVTTRERNILIHDYIYQKYPVAEFLLLISENKPVEAISTNSNFLYYDYSIDANISGIITVAQEILRKMQHNTVMKQKI